MSSNCVSIKTKHNLERTIASHTSFVSEMLLTSGQFVLMPPIRSSGRHNFDRLVRNELTTEQ